MEGEPRDPSAPASGPDEPLDIPEFPDEVLAPDDETEPGTPWFRRVLPWLRRAVKWTAFAIVALGLGGAVFLFWSIQRAKPAVDGEIALRGIDAPVELIRDPQGVVHVYGASLRDIYFGQGFAHAQDRFWQMDTWRHIGSGTLSEMFGADQVETDVFLRSMQWRDLARIQLAGTTPQNREALAAYAAGVNAYLEMRSPSELALEYTILELANHDYTPEPWTPLDTLTWGKVMAWELGGNLRDEIDRSFILGALTPDAADVLYPPYPADHPVIVGGNDTRVTGPGLDPPPIDSQLALKRAADNVALIEALVGPTGDGIGSNSFVIGPDRTRTGAPILANDTHLGIQKPSIWHQMGLHCAPRTRSCPLEVAGFTFAGSPGVIVGHNRDIAWGVTNLNPDVMDLYIERINPANPNQYEVNGRWVDMELRTEVIEVAGGDRVPVTLRYTRHGPVISDTYEPLEDVAVTGGMGLPESYAISLRWTALDDTGGGIVDAVFGLNHASNWDEFREAARSFDVPAQNLVYADTAGNIGYQMPGRVPIRAAGTGQVPVPGWTDDFEWTGFVPFDELPSIYNPDSGFIVTANNPVVDGAFPHLLSTDWNYGDRAARLTELLAADSTVTVAEVERFQFDNHDSTAADLVPYFAALDLTGGGEAHGIAAAIMTNWNYEAADTSPGAAIWAATWRRLLENTFHDDLPEDQWPGGGSRWHAVVAALAGEPTASFWDNRSTPAVEDRDAIMLESFNEAIADLTAELGSDPTTWRWGNLHTASFESQTLGQSGIGFIEWLFNTNGGPVSGGDDLVNATGWTATEGFAVDWIPAMRMIIDLGDLDRSLTVHPPGQSGHAFHPHSEDLIRLWATGSYYPMRWSRNVIESTAESTLTLVPEFG